MGAGDIIHQISTAVAVRTGRQEEYVLDGPTQTGLNRALYILGQMASETVMVHGSAYPIV